MTVRAYKLGALGQDDLTGVKFMCASLVANAAGYMTLENPVGTDYQVASGKTLYVTKMDLHSDAAANFLVYLGYGDNGVAEGVAAPTNYVEVTAGYFATSAQHSAPFDILITIPSLKYPCVRVKTAQKGEINIYGIEV